MNRFFNVPGEAQNERHSWSLETDKIKSKIPEKMKSESEPLMVDVGMLLRLVKESCFAFLTHHVQKKKMNILCNAYWKKEGAQYLRSIRGGEEAKNSKKDEKLENITLVDLVLRLFVSSLCVRYVAFSPTEVFYHFLKKCRDMGCFTWSTMYLFTSVAYKLNDKDKPYTYLKRWLDSYSKARAAQWKNLLSTLHMPSHMQVMGCLTNLLPSFRTLGEENGMFPVRSSEYLQYPDIFSICIDQPDKDIERFSSLDKDGNRHGYNFWIEACGLTRIQIQHVSIKIRQYFEWDGDLREEGWVLEDYIRKDGPRMLLAKVYLCAYSKYTDDGKKIVPTRCPRVDDRTQPDTPTLAAFPHIEDFKQASFAIIDFMSRYELLNR